MMKAIFFTFVMIAFCNVMIFSQNQPQVDIKVNKEYDEFGNVIRYDSTYTSFYSSRNISKLDSAFFKDKLAEFGFDEDPFKNFSLNNDFHFPAFPSFEELMNRKFMFENDSIFDQFNQMHKKLMEKMHTETEKETKKKLFDDSETFNL